MQEAVGRLETLADQLAGPLPPACSQPDELKAESGIFGEVKTYAHALDTLSSRAHMAMSRIQDVL